MKPIILIKNQIKIVERNGNVFLNQKVVNQSYAYEKALCKRGVE